VIALFLTFVVAAYLLGPDLVSRFILGFVCPRKNIVQSKGEEITRAVFWAVAPLAAALFWAWKYGTLLKCAGLPEWKLFFAGAYSDVFFEKHDQAVFHATKAVFLWNVVVLWRMYLIVVLFWIGVDIIVHNFGSIRHYLNKEQAGKVPDQKTFMAVMRRIGGAARVILQKFLGFFIIPRVSEWHVLLSSMLTERKDIRVQADILTKGNVLYKGFVADKFLTGDGDLRGIVLADPQRFRREEYMHYKQKHGLITTDSAPYWTAIPSNTFIVMATEVVSINLQHSSPSAVASDEGIIEAILKALESSKTNH
jgi:hypothetical protein